MTGKNDDILVLEVFYWVKLSANTRWWLYIIGVLGHFLLLIHLSYHLCHSYLKSKSMRFVSSQGNFSTERCIRKKKAPQQSSKWVVFISSELEGKNSWRNDNEQDKDVINIVTNQSLTMKETSRKHQIYTHTEYSISI